MLNKTSMLLAVSVVALGAGAAHADDGNRNHQDNPAAVTMPGEPNQPVYGNGYNYGYDDGYARRERDDRYRADAWRAHDGDHGYQHGDRGYQRGAYYYGSDCNDNAVAGTLMGAAVGGVIGNQVGHGNGGATAAGVILGGLAGNSISRDMDCSDRHYALTSYSAGFEGRIGERQDWHNGNNRGSFTPTREYSRNGNVCRDFQEASYRGDGYHYARNGTACRRNDGNWYME